MSDSDFEEMIKPIPDKAYRWLTSMAEERAGHYSYEEYRKMLEQLCLEYKEAHDL